MTTMASLLPPASAPLERALDKTVAARLSALPALVAGLWNADNCPAQLLPYLAWALSVDEWDEKFGEDKKRNLIKESRLIHQQKGTLAAIKRALTAIGQPNATIVERGNYTKRNGVAIRDATRQRLSQGGWASYRVTLYSATTIDQAMQIKRLLASVQRNCIELTAIDFKQAALRRNASALRNGAYTRGVVDTTIN